MKKASLFLIIGVLNFSIPVIAQMKKVAPERVPIEKVYLHVDRQYYTNNDDIWFKAYLTDAATNKCSEISNNLYVELVSSVRSIEKRTCIRLDKGLGIGDFHLDDSIPSGRYQIR